MELITAIALLCQISFGSGDRSNPAYYINHITEKQQSCQKQLSECILKKDDKAENFRVSSALKCLKER